MQSVFSDNDLISKDNEPTNYIKIDSIQNTIGYNARLTKVYPIVTRLALYLIAHSGIVISRTELANQVWNRELVSDDAINRTISLLRKALSNNHSAFIQTVPKQGYCFVIPENVEVQLISKAESPIEAELENEAESQREPITIDTNNNNLPTTTIVQKVKIRATTGLTFATVFSILAASFYLSQYTRYVA